MSDLVKFIYSEKPSKFFEISTLDLTGTTEDKSTVEILQNFVAFSECMNFNDFLVIRDSSPHDLYKITLTVVGKFVLRSSSTRAYTVHTVWCVLFSSALH